MSFLFINLIIRRYVERSEWGIDCILFGIKLYLGIVPQAPNGSDFKDISKLSQSMATTYPLAIAIEHTLQIGPLVDFSQEVTIALDSVCMVKF